MTTALGLTDGTTTYNLNSVGGAYELLYDQWAPQIALLQKNELIGSGPYLDVEEQIPLLVRDAASVDALIHVSRLRTLLDQVERWKRGDTVAAVTLTYRPNGSAAGSDYQVVVLDVLGVEIPPRLNDPNNDVIVPVTLRVKRRAQWLGATDTGSSTGTSSAVVAITGLANHTPLSPATLTISDLLYTAGGSDGRYIAATGTRSIILMTSGTDLLRVYSATAASTAVSFASFATSFGFPVQGTNVMRLTAASGSLSGWSLPANLRARRRYGVFLTVIKEGGTDVWQPSMTPIVQTTTPQIRLTTVAGAPISGGIGTPFPIFLGVVATPTDIADIEIAMTRLSGSGAIQVDAVAFIALDSQATRVLDTGTIDRNVFTSATANELFADHRILGGVTPLIVHRRTATPTDLYPITTSGDHILLVSGTRVEVAWLATCTNGITTAYWRIPASGAGSALTMTFAIGRTRAYLTPE